MKRVIAVAGAIFFSACYAFGQAPAARPEFDVADIKRNVSGGAQVEGGVLPGGNFSMRNVPLKALLGFAFNVPKQKVRQQLHHWCAKLGRLRSLRHHWESAGRYARPPMFLLAFLHAG
jgi:hypothetical protein